MTRVGILGAPRPVPERRRWVPAAAGALAVALALPLFLVAGWPVSGWAVATLLWAAGHGFSALLARLKPSPDNLAVSGMLAFGMMLKLLVVLVVLVALAASDRDAGLAAALVYGLAYTAELVMSLVGYYSQEPTA